MPSCDERNTPEVIIDQPPTIGQLEAHVGPDAREVLGECDVCLAERVREAR